MEHPLIGNLENCTEEDLNNKISELNKKLIMASRTGNGYLCSQIRMALESYQNRYRSMQDQKNQGDSGNLHFDKIDIS
jgi:hypothetical protein